MQLITHSYMYSTCVCTFTVILPAKYWHLLSKINISVFNQEAVDYFTKRSNEILSAEDENSNRRDFVQLCKNRLIEDPKLGDVDIEIDHKGFIWSQKGNLIHSNTIHGINGYTIEGMYKIQYCTVNVQYQKGR